MGGDIQDGFGDTIHNYHRWLYRLAYDMLPMGSPYVDDLVQEGRIAMWRATKTFEPDRGSLVSWITTAAQQRMKDIAHGKGQPTGHQEMRGSKPAEEKSLESIVQAHEGQEDVLDFLKIDSLSDVEIAYHHGEIMDALTTLTPKQREYVFLRFWGDIDPKSRHPYTREVIALYPVMRQRWLWSGTSRQVGAKQRLFEALEHLAS